MIQLHNELAFNYKTQDGKDISDVIRGKIIMLDNMMNILGIFDRYDKMKELVEKNKGVNN